MKSEHGFSLLEVVISTAVIAILSEFILQMFLVSISLNQKAYNLDMGVNKASHAMETLKDEELPGNGVVLTQYYDGNWREIAAGQIGPSQNINALIPKSIKYILNLNVAEDRFNNTEILISFDSNGNCVTGSVKSSLYRIGAAVYEVKANGERVEICSLNTCRYLQLR